MNKQRRNRIAEELELISQARDILEEVKDEEQESYENLPESLQYNAKSSPHGKTKRQNRRAAHMERQRAPPKGREAENGSRGIDSRGRIPERLCRCHSRYA